jgi:hypothetical protein
MVNNKELAGIYLFLFTIQLISLNVKCEMLAENVAIAINCGGDTYTDSRGITYERVK